MAKRKYSYAEKKAYNMGLGAGLANASADNVGYICDERQGRGQNSRECASFLAGYNRGYKNRYGVIPFAKHKEDRKLYK
ncbi:MAG: hypothetical protein ACI4QI_03330 [Candidatus Coproplasma sp.]